MDTHWKKFKTLGPALDRAARGIAIAGLLALTFGPLPLQQQPGSTQAASLEWEDMRPAYTDANTSATAAAGFTYLAPSGTVTHVMAVAPNGDIFAGGCNGATTAACTGARVYKSTDKGLSWRQSAALGGAASNIVGLAISPKYPSDNVVIAAFSDGLGGTALSDGVSVSTDGGVTFTAAGVTEANILTAIGAATVIADYAITSVAVSSDFERSSNSGEYAIGLERIAAPAAGVSSTSVIRRTKPADASAAANTIAITQDATVGTCFGAAAVNGFAASTLALKYSPKFATDGVLARLLVSGAGSGAPGTWAQRKNTATFPCMSVASDQVNAGFATAGGIGIAADYLDTGAGGTYFVSIAGAAAANDVYKRVGGAWTAQLANGAATNINFTGMDFMGNLQDGTLAASEGAGGTRVFRTTNAGSSWSSKSYGGDNKEMDITAGTTKIAINPMANGEFYVGSAGAAVAGTTAAGGVHRSLNRGSSWTDTGLVNLTTTAATLVSDLPEQGSGNTWFLRQGGAVWKTTNFGASAAWQRVERIDGVSGVVVPGDFATSGVAYLRRGGVTTSGGVKIMKSTDGGVNFKVIDTIPEGDKGLSTMSCVSATRCWVGTTDGVIWETNDGGGSWEKSATDLGQDVGTFRRSPSFSTDNIIWISANSDSSAQENWRSTDAGKTWTMVGTSSGAWGTGIGCPATAIAGTATTTTASAAGLGSLRLVDAKRAIYRPACGAQEDDLYRFEVDKSTAWTALGSPTGIRPFGTALHTSAAGIGDGVLLQFMDYQTAANTGPRLLRTYHPFTVNSGTWDTLVTVGAPVLRTGSALSILSAGITNYTSAEGRTYLVVSVSTAGAGSVGRLVAWTDTTAYLGQPKLVSPLNNSNVPTNVGDNGVPATLTWTNIDRAQCWALQISLDAEFQQKLVDGSSVATFATCGSGAGTINGTTRNPSIVVSRDATSATNAQSSLVQGNTYHWRVRAQFVGPSTTDNLLQPGPWSGAYKFSVASQGAPTSPAPSLPLDGSQLPGLATQLSWNNPAGTTQVQVQVTPLNGDGPAINLIFGSSLNSYDVPPPVFGTGPYVVLPGASYTWRVRTTNASTSVGEADASWGPWSTPRSFTTALPNAGTIQQLAPINGESVSTGTPTLQWKDANAAMFYYEVQLSSDKDFGVGAGGPIAPVIYELRHGGTTTPPNSYTVPSTATLAKGTYYWRLRQRVQATAKGTAETGIAWSPAQMFVVR